MAKDYRIHKKVQNKVNEILEGNGKLIIEIAKEIANETTADNKDEKGVSTSQIRRIFGDLKRQQKNFNIDQVQLIRPKLAYTFARHSSRKGMDLLMGTLDFLLEKVEKKIDFNSVVSFFESIIAYHKKFGGK